MPQDDATQCNALEAHQSHSNDEIKCASEWIVFAQLPKSVHKCMGFQVSGHGRPPPLFIATQANRAVVPLRAVSMRAPDRAVPGTGQGGGALQRSNSKAVAPP